MKKTIAMYIRKKPFIFDDYVYIYNYIFIANPANILLNRCIFSREFLIAYYEKTIQKTILQITNKSYLNFITNKMSNIRKK